MRKYSFIMIGGALGAVLRLAAKNISIGQYNGGFPLNTLIINITGSFVLALFLTLSYEVFEIDADIRLGISTGFLGAYTTFSTLCKEAVILILNREYITAVSYLTASIVLGLAAAYLGVVLARGAIGRLADRGDVE
jgi:fluoride exporter